MKRIDSANARSNVNGLGKAGFHDNADLSGQDATYLTPDYLNHLQEELCNLLEKNGVTLAPEKRDQLFDLLATFNDIEALAEAVQILLDNKYDKTGGIINGNVDVNGGFIVRGHPLDIDTTIDSNYPKQTRIAHYNDGNTHIITTLNKFIFEAPIYQGGYDPAPPDGYTTLINGFIMQFGYIDFNHMTPIVGGGSVEKIATIEFPTVFLQHAFSAQLTVKATNGGILSDLFPQVVSMDLTSLTLKTQTIQGGDVADGIDGIYWTAIGR
jgi:hypothetical protein